MKHRMSELESEYYEKVLADVEDVRTSYYKRDLEKRGLWDEDNDVIDYLRDLEIAMIVFYEDKIPHNSLSYIQRRTGMLNLYQDLRLKKAAIVAHTLDEEKEYTGGNDSFLIIVGAAESALENVMNNLARSIVDFELENRDYVETRLGLVSDVNDETAISTKKNTRKGSAR